MTEQTFNLPESLAAPVTQGEVVGSVTISIEGEEVGTVDLIAGSNVSRNQVLYTLSRVGEFFSLDLLQGRRHPHDGHGGDLRLCLGGGDAHRPQRRRKAQARLTPALFIPDTRHKRSYALCWISNAT